MPRPTEVRKTRLDSTATQANSKLQVSQSQRIRLPRSQGDGISQFLNNLTDFAARKHLDDRRVAKTQADANDAADATAAVAAGLEPDPQRLADSEVFAATYNTVKGDTEALAFTTSALEDVDQLIAQSRADGLEFDAEGELERVIAPFVDSEAFQDRAFASGASPRILEFRQKFLAKALQADAKLKLEEGEITLLQRAAVTAGTPDFDPKRIIREGIELLGMSPNDALKSTVEGLKSFFEQNNDAEAIERVFERTMSALSPKQKALFGDELTDYHQSAATRVDTNRLQLSTDDKLAISELTIGIEQSIADGNLRGIRSRIDEARGTFGEGFQSTKEALLRQVRRAEESAKTEAGIGSHVVELMDNPAAFRAMLAAPGSFYEARGISGVTQKQVTDILDVRSQAATEALSGLMTEVSQMTPGTPEYEQAINDVRTSIRGLAPLFQASVGTGYVAPAFKLFEGARLTGGSLTQGQAEAYAAMKDQFGFVPGIGADSVLALESYLSWRSLGKTHNEITEHFKTTDPLSARQATQRIREHPDHDRILENTTDAILDGADVDDMPRLQEYRAEILEMAGDLMTFGGMGITQAVETAGKNWIDQRVRFGNHWIDQKYMPPGYSSIIEEAMPLLVEALGAAPEQESRLVAGARFAAGPALTELVSKTKEALASDEPPPAPPPNPFGNIDPERISGYTPGDKLTFVPMPNADRTGAIAAINETGEVIRIDGHTWTLNTEQLVRAVAEYQGVKTDAEYRKWYNARLE